MVPEIRTSRIVFVLIAAVVLSFQDAAAQTVEPCEVEVDRAEEHYRDGEFEQAERILLACLDTSELSDAIAVRGYRILAQAQLHTGDIAGARRAVLRVFARNPAYRTDPVQDPPAYQALVETVRQQLADADFEADLDQMRRIPPEPVIVRRDVPHHRAAGDVFVQVLIGANSYGGERGTDGGSVFSEFFDNGGPSFAVAGGYNISDNFALMLAYDVGRYASIFDHKSGFPEVDSDVSSAWLHTISGTLVARFLPSRLATPYLRGGVGSSFIRVNESMQSAVALDIGLGVDVAVTRSIVIFAEAGGRYTMPGDAIDLVDRARSYDFLSLFRVGVSFSAGSIR